MTYYPANKRYREKAIRHIGFDLNRNTEPELVEHMEAIENKSEYLKRLIREDIERSRKED